MPLPFLGGIAGSIIAKKINEFLKGGLMMDIRTETGTKIIYIMPRFDSQASREVEQTLNEIIKADHKKILCNFKETKYISSAGLRVLLSVAKTLKRLGGGLYLCSIQEYVQEVFETSGLTNVLTCFESEEAAIKHLSHE